MCCSWYTYVCSCFSCFHLLVYCSVSWDCHCIPSLHTQALPTRRPVRSRGFKCNRNESVQPNGFALLGVQKLKRKCCASLTCAPAFVFILCLSSCRKPIMLRVSGLDEDECVCIFVWVANWLEIKSCYVPTLTTPACTAIFPTLFFLTILVIFLHLHITRLSYLSAIIICVCVFPRPLAVKILYRSVISKRVIINKKKKQTRKKQIHKA